MKTATPIVLIVTAILSSVPTALAWGAMGSHEPDTQYDIDHGWMFPGADTSPCTKSGCDTNDVYLNGFFESCYSVFTPGNHAAVEGCYPLTPNLATLQTSVHQPEYLMAAILGVWKDCNNDGYIGLGDQGLFEYREEILAHTSSLPNGPGESICPVTPTPTQSNGRIPENWTASHNDGTWVREFLSLQPRNYGSVIGDLNPYNLNDNDAKVWADVGLPGDFHFTCYYASYPTGTFHSTGGLLHTFDCLDGYRATDNFDAVADSNGATQPLSFSDHPRDQENSASTLEIKNPWGVPSDASEVSAWDCSAPVVDQHQDLGKNPTNSNSELWANATAYAPQVPPATDTTGSPSGTMNETGDQCSRDTRGSDNTESTAPYVLEAGTTLPPFKQYTDTLTAVEQTRPTAPLSAVLGKATPPDLGLHSYPSPCSTVVLVVIGTNSNVAGNCWNNDGIYVGNRFYHQETLFTDANGGNIGSVPHFSTYAYVDPTAISLYHLSLPKSAYGSALVTGTYGSEPCGSFASGVHDRWDCDPTHWTSSVKVGDAYDLLDVDCYDQSAGAARTAGVGYGVLTGTACDSL